METRAQQIYSRFEQFHLSNIDLWRWIVENADRLRRAGRDQYSMMTLIAVARFRRDVSTVTDEPVKINNDYSPYYARLYLALRPEADGFFRLGKLVSEDEPARDVDQATNILPDSGDEDWLRGKIQELLERTQGNGGSDRPGS